jgi:hypothetical protein
LSFVFALRMHDGYVEGELFDWNARARNHG